MVWLVGIFGFIGGFSLALLLLNHFLRDASREELLKDSSLKFKYGMLAWLIAIAGCWCAVYVYRLYFPEMPTP